MKSWRTHQRVESLKYCHNNSDKHQYVFTTVSDNKPLYPEHCNKALFLICGKNNFKRIKDYGFRNTHCSLLFEAGLSIREVQDRLNHEDIKTTMVIYAHVTEKQRDQVADKFAEHINF